MGFEEYDEEYHDMPATATDPRKLRQDECINCGDPSRDNLHIDEIKWDDRGDALCAECGDLRGVDSFDDDVRTVGVGDLEDFNQGDTA